MCMTKKENESIYIQQHLANERTYLAWIRTSIATLGIGFVAGGLHFNSGENLSEAADTLIIAVIIFSLAASAGLLLFSTYHYFSTRKKINSQTYQSSHALVIFVSMIMLMLIGALIFYFFNIT